MALAGDAHYGGRPLLRLLRRKKLSECQGSPPRPQFLVLCLTPQPPQLHSLPSHSETVAQLSPTQSWHAHLVDAQPGPTSGHPAPNNGNPRHLQRLRHWTPGIRPALLHGLCAYLASLESLHQSMGRVEGA
jgi:hypothetical protein